MRSFVLLAIVLLTLSCGTEKHYFQKSLSNADKMYLNDKDTLIKKFSGKANWYRQYWIGYLSVRKIGKGYAINLVGEWRQTSDDGSVLWTIANFDEFGYIIDERILGDQECHQLVRHIVARTQLMAKFDLYAKSLTDTTMDNLKKRDKE